MLVYAAHLEGRLVASERSDALQIGVGKAQAASGMTRALLERPRPRYVLLFGVCGAYPSRDMELQLGQICFVTSDALIDEGVETDGGFVSLKQLGLAEVGPFTADMRLTREACGRFESASLVHGATVSTCSGTLDLACTRASRVGAQIETMEGAAVAMVCAAFDVPFVQLRAVSNRVGTRDSRHWDLEGASMRAQQAVLELLATGWGDG